MSTKNLKTLSDAERTLIAEVAKTRSTVALAMFTKQAINTRDFLLGKDSFELEHNFEKITDAKARARTQRICSAIDKMTSKKAVAALCATVISTRALVRAEKAEKSGEKRA